MPDTLWTSADFKKKLTVFEGSDGVGKIASDVPAKLNAYHAYAKKEKWGQADNVLHEIRTDLKKYQDSAKKTITQIRKDKKDKARNSKLDSWEKNLRELQDQAQACRGKVSKIKSLMSNVSIQKNMAARDLTALNKNIDKLDDKNCNSQIQKILDDRVKNIASTLEKLTPIRSTWGKSLKEAKNLSELQGKTFDKNQAKKVLKLLQSALKKIGA